MAWRHVGTGTERPNTEQMKRWLRARPKGPSGPLDDDLTRYGCEEFTPTPPPPPTVKHAARVRRRNIRRELKNARLATLSDDAEEQLERVSLVVGWITKQLKTSGNSIYSDAPAAMQGMMDRLEDDFDSAVPYHTSYRDAIAEIIAIVQDASKTDEQKRADIAAVTWSVP